MSCLLELLRCILCCEEDEIRRDYQTISDRNFSTTQEYRGHGTFVTTPSPSYYNPPVLVEGANNRTRIEKETYRSSVSVDSILIGSSKDSRVNPPQVTQKPIRLPAPSPAPKVTQTPILLPPPLPKVTQTPKLLPQPSPPSKVTQTRIAPSPSSVHHKNSTDSAINNSSISIKPEKFKISLAEGSQTRKSLASAPPPSSTGPPPSACKPPPSSSSFPSELTSLPKNTKSVRDQKGTTSTYVDLTKRNTSIVYAIPEDRAEGLHTRKSLAPAPPPSSCGPPQSGFKPPPSSSPFPSGPPNSPNKTEYVWVNNGMPFIYDKSNDIEGLIKDTTLIYAIPEDIKDLIKRDIVPPVLKKHLAQSTYKDYFGALLYAEDFYNEKWSNFLLKNVTLKVEEAKIYKKVKKNKNFLESDEADDKFFVTFKVDLIPEKRPFLLSRDFVILQPSGQKIEPFKGILYRVVEGNRVVAEFGDDFLCQHLPNHRYDVSFSFNRVCLKRSHQAISAAIDPLFRAFLFPDQISRISISAPPLIPYHRNLDRDQISAIQQITSLRGPPPYLIDGPLSFTRTDELSRAGLVIREAVLQIYRTFPSCRILINSPKNITCDKLLKTLKVEIPESDMFRANAAFREYDGVLYDVLPSCLYKGECFTCPSLQELRNYKVIFSTFVSSFRLHSKGICAGHFSHVFLVDASSATEPEVLVSLSNLVDEKTTVVVSGAFHNCSSWVRSTIARGNGLKKSYFERLLENKPYCSFDPMFVTHLKDKGSEYF